MTKDEALRLALEALYGFIPYLPLEHDKPQCDRYDQAITAIKAALVAKDEPVAWPCLIANADFDKDTVTLVMQCSDYKVSAGMHWLLTTPPQRTWVGLTDIDYAGLPLEQVGLVRWAEAKLKAKNT
jgi:hypothetical protein